MAEGGIEKHAIQTFLGTEEDGICTSDPYHLVVKDHGMKSGLQFQSVCITPVGDSTADETSEKTVQVLYTQDTKMQGNLKFATVAICETPRQISDDNTVSKMVRLRKNDSALEKMAASQTVGSEEKSGIFASDPEALKYFKFGTGPEISDPSKACQQEGNIRLGPEPTADFSAEEQEGIFASDPEALKYFKFAPNIASASPKEAQNDAAEIFASDPEALKYIRFGSQTEPKAFSDADESEGIFASDAEALQWIKPIPKQSEQKKMPENQSQDGGGFASDSDTLKAIQSKTSEAAGGSASRAEDGEGSLIAEATGIHLKDNRTYSVRISGHDLPDGQRKKFVSVRSSDGSGGPTSQEIDAMRVTVETKVSEDGLVEKFVVVE